MMIVVELNEGEKRRLIEICDSVVDFNDQFSQFLSPLLLSSSSSSNSNSNNHNLMKIIKILKFASKRNLEVVMIFFSSSSNLDHDDSLLSLFLSFILLPILSSLQSPCSRSLFHPILQLTNSFPTMVVEFLLIPLLVHSISKDDKDQEEEEEKREKNRNQNSPQFEVCSRLIKSSTTIIVNNHQTSHKSSKDRDKLGQRSLFGDVFLWRMLSNTSNQHVNFQSKNKQEDDHLTHCKSTINKIISNQHDDKELEIIHNNYHHHKITLWTIETLPLISTILQQKNSFLSQVLSLFSSMFNSYPFSYDRKPSTFSCPILPWQHLPPPLLLIWGVWEGVCGLGRSSNNLSPTINKQLVNRNKNSRRL